jgi:hypothetical protein
VTEVYQNVKNAKGCVKKWKLIFYDNALVKYCLKNGLDETSVIMVVIYFYVRKDNSKDNVIK